MAFSPDLYAELIRDSIFLTNGLPPEIQVWDQEGNLARTITVPAPEVNSSEAWTQLEEVLLTRGNQFELRWFEDELQPRDGPVPPISMMLVDDQQRLWVKMYDPRTDSHLLTTGRRTGGEWLILDLSGAVVATTHLPEGFLLLDVRGGRLLGKTRDALGVERVQVYEIVE